MNDKLLGSERVLHQGAGYRTKFRAARGTLLPGTRENPSSPKQEGVDATYIPDTAKWCSKK